ncbi:hypothetical protein RKD29_005998 [Streptomyces tendae]
MLGFLVRLLPFWVREPLLILVGAVFGVRITYLAHRDGEGVAAAIGLVFLVFTAVRVHTVARALRARRAPAPAVAPAVAPVAAVAAEKEPNAWGQAFAAVAVFAALGSALWLGPHLLPADDDGAPRAASCAGGEDEELPGAYRRTPRAVTGDELCNALNRTDLAHLLGTPAETATAVSGTSNTAPLTDGKVAQPEAEVQFDTYTVDVTVTYNELSIAQYVKFMEYGEETDVKTLSVLGRPCGPRLGPHHEDRDQSRGRRFRRTGRTGPPGAHPVRGPRRQGPGRVLRHHRMEHVRSPPGRRRPAGHRREGAPDDPRTHRVTTSVNPPNQRTGTQSVAAAACCSSAPPHPRTAEVNPSRRATGTSMSNTIRLTQPPANPSPRETEGFPGCSSSSDRRAARVLRSKRMVTCWNGTSCIAARFTGPRPTRGRAERPQGPWLDAAFD